MKEKQNPNERKPKRLSFDKWVATLGLCKENVPCEVCDSRGTFICEVCEGSGTVECDKCPGSGLIGDCVWCGNEGGYTDNYPGIESTGWAVCAHCHGDPNVKCECGGKGETICEDHGCDGGVIECAECEGDGNCAKYSPRSLEHLEELRDGSVFLFQDEDSTCDYSDLVDVYQWILSEEDRLIKERGLSL